MNSCLIELHYLPSIQYFSLFYSHINVILEKHEHYQKGSYRNRSYIGSAQGRQMLSVPLLKGKHQQLPIHEVKIAYHTPWHAQHWHAIQTAYGKTPFFEHYADDLQVILYEKHEKLWDLNIALLKYLLDAFQIKTQISETTDYEKVLPPNIHDKRNTLSPDVIPILPSYEQVFTDRLPFQSNLSALDLLLHQGPHAITYLTS